MQHNTERSEGLRRLAQDMLRSNQENDEKFAKHIRNKLCSEQIRGARAMLKIDQSKLAELSGVPLATLARIEEKDGLLSPSAKKFADCIVSALEGSGIEFIPEDGKKGEKGGGVRLKAKVL